MFLKLGGVEKDSVVWEEWAKQVGGESSEKTSHGGSDAAMEPSALRPNLRFVG